MKTSCGNKIWASFLTLAEGFCHLGESSDVESRRQVLHGGLVTLSVLPGHQEQFGLHVHIFAVRLDLPQFRRLHLQMSGQRLPPSAQLGCHVVHLLVGHHLVLYAGTWAKNGKDDEDTPGNYNSLENSTNRWLDVLSLLSLRRLSPLSSSSSSPVLISSQGMSFYKCQIKLKINIWHFSVRCFKKKPKKNSICQGSPAALWLVC